MERYWTYAEALDHEGALVAVWRQEKAPLPDSDALQALLEAIETPSTKEKSKALFEQMLALLGDDDL